MNSNIKYTGKVSFKKKIGDIFVEIAQGHNNGSDALFELLTEFLAGNKLTNTDLPQYINIIAGSNSVLFAPVRVTKTTEYDSSEGKYYAVMEALIYHANINSVALSDITECSLQLLNGKPTSTILATHTFDANVIKQIKNGMQLLLTWKLNFANE